jgi:hypothetical protein
VVVVDEAGQTGARQLSLASDRSVSRSRAAMRQLRSIRNELEALQAHHAALVELRDRCIALGTGRMGSTRCSLLHD